MRQSFLFLLFVFPCPTLTAQSTADRELIKNARALYSTPASRPAYIACESAVDWDAVAKDDNVPQTEGYQRGLALMKGLKTSFVTRDSKHTDVTVTGDAMLAQQKKMVQGQITQFFERYWTTNDGRLLPTADRTYQLTRTPGGYSIAEQGAKGTADEVQMDDSFVVTKARAVVGTSEMVLTPRFVRENDGLLHLNGLSIDEQMGASRMVVDFSFDYQQVGGFYIPQHVTMSLVGSHRYTYTFNNCQAFEKHNAPAATPAPPNQHE